MNRKIFAGFNFFLDERGHVSMCTYKHFFAGLQLTVKNVTIGPLENFLIYVPGTRMYCPLYRFGYLFVVSYGDSSIGSGDVHKLFLDRVCLLSKDNLL